MPENNTPYPIRSDGVWTDGTEQIISYDTANVLRYTSTNDDGMIGLTNITYDYDAANIEATPYDTTSNLNYINYLNQFQGTEFDWRCQNLWGINLVDAGVLQGCSETEEELSDSSHELDDFLDEFIQKKR